MPDDTITSFANGCLTWVLPMNDRELSHNASGYSDPTAYAAFKRIGADKDTVQKVRQGIYLLCDLAGLRVEGRIVLIDKKTGRIWK